MNGIPKQEYGWAMTARSLGWMTAPLVSGALACIFGLRAVFITAAACYFLLIPLIAWIVRYLPRTPPIIGSKAPTT